MKNDPFVYVISVLSSVKKIFSSSVLPWLDFEMSKLVCFCDSLISAPLKVMRKTSHVWPNLMVFRPLGETMRETGLFF